MRTIRATRYVTPLREGGSLPAIVEADDDGLYVLKFRGAGQGPRALIAELVVGELARAAGLPVPEIVFAHLDADLARTEPDAEIQDLIRASADLVDVSVGLNLALDYLPGSVTFDPLAFRPDAELASRIVWFDAFTTNLDRTARNTNMLVWHGKLWLIDHGAALYFHHASNDFMARADAAFAPIADHVLLPFASRLAEVDEAMAVRFTPEVVDAVVALIPDGWLADDPFFATKAQHRAAYASYLRRRPHPARMTTRSCASCRASSAASSSTSARSSHRTPGGISPHASRSTTRASSPSTPRCTSPPCASRSTPSPPSAPAGRVPARSASCRCASASTGWSRRAAR